MTTKPPPRSIGQEATAAQHRSAASGKKPPQHRIGQEATDRRAASGKKPPSRRRRLAPFDPRTHDFTFILHISPPPISLCFNFSFQLLDWPVGSDSLNISPRARWVVPPGPHPRARPAVYIPPAGSRIEKKKIPCSDGRFPAAWPLGQQREE